MTDIQVAGIATLGVYSLMWYKEYHTFKKVMIEKARRSPAHMNEDQLHKFCLRQSFSWPGYYALAIYDLIRGVR